MQAGKGGSPAGKGGMAGQIAPSAAADMKVGMSAGQALPPMPTPKLPAMGGGSPQFNSPMQMGGLKDIAGQIMKNPGIMDKIGQMAPGLEKKLPGMGALESLRGGGNIFDGKMLGSQNASPGLGSNGMLQPKGPLDQKGPMPMNNLGGQPSGLAKELAGLNQQKGMLGAQQTPTALQKPQYLPGGLTDKVGSIGQQPNKLPGQFNDMLKQGMQQSQPGLNKIGKALNPFGAAQAAPGDSQLGSLSAKYESGNRGVEAMNPDALGRKTWDKGGPSYGQYQLAANTGTLGAYIKQSPYAKDFAGLKPGTPEFNAKWKALAQDPAFGQSQHDYIKKTHYDSVRAYADKVGIPNDPTINNALWSTGVQHGPGKEGGTKGAIPLLQKAGINGNMPKDQIIKSLYQQRESAFPKTAPRYQTEMRDALNQLKGGSPDIKAGSLNPVGDAKSQPLMMNSGNDRPMPSKISDQGVQALSQRTGVQLDDNKIARTMPAKNNLDAATKYLGMNEHDGRPALSGFFQKAGINIDPAKTPWCAAFVDATLKSNGMKGTGSLMAKSYLEWGTPTSKPTNGDIVVLNRGAPGSPQGHVGFFAGTETIGGRDYVKILGGNQNDSVSVSKYPMDRVVGFRKPPTNMADAVNMMPDTSQPSNFMGGNVAGQSPVVANQANTPGQGPSAQQGFLQGLWDKISGGNNQGGSQTNSKMASLDMGAAQAPEPVSVQNSAPDFSSRLKSLANNMPQLRKSKPVKRLST